MTFKVTFLEIAKEDVGDAIEWYEKHQKGLGAKFLAEIEQSVESVQAMPKAFPRKFKNLRAVLIKSFPYALFYRIENGSYIRIYACLHLSRNISKVLEDR
ncbi:MAG TPA: type II toxin-antitoxin system RelE/ParE family toxin [Balneolaceae bacterium]